MDTKSRDDSPAARLPSAVPERQASYRSGEVEPSMVMVNPGRTRYWIYLILFLMSAIAYADRAVLSVAMPSIAREFDLDPVATGWLLSSFLWTYTLLNLPTAMLVVRFGARRVAAWAVSVWSVAMILSGLSLGFFSMLVGRLLLGIGEAPTMPAGYSAIRDWAPRQERGFASAVLYAGIPGGITLGAIVGAYGTDAFGWRALFILFALVGFGWVILWLAVFRSPDQAKWLDESEYRYIVAQRGDSSDVSSKISVRSILRSPSAWGIIVPQVCANYVNFLFLTWLPTYFVSSRNMTLVEAGMGTAVCYALAGVGSIVASIFVDRLLRPRRDVALRRVFIAAFLAVAAASLLSLTFAPAGLVLPLITLSLLGIQSGLSNNQALVSDLLEDGRAISPVIGLILTFSNGVGLLAPIVTGVLVERFSGFTAAFQVGAAALAIGTLVVLALPRRLISVKPPAQALVSPGG